MNSHQYRCLPQYERSEHFDLQYRLYPTLVNDQRRMVYEATLKAEGGVLIWCETWHEQRPGNAQMARRCAQFGRLSRRPYVVGQATDESTSDCVWALYSHYCLSADIDPTGLLTRTYPGWETAENWTGRDWASVTESAQWQGTTLPSNWTTDAVIGLLMSLCGQGRRALAETLTQEIVLRSGGPAAGARS